MLDHFDLIASMYDKLIGQHDTSRLKELLQLPTNGILLDAGGGTGRVSQQFSDMVSHIVVTDLSTKMLEQAKSKGQLLTVKAHVEMLPFPANIFDRILVVDAFHHFCNQQESLRDLVRVLKPGGIGIIEEPDINRFPVKIVAILEKLALMRSHFHSPQNIQIMLNKMSIESKIEYDGKYSAWILFEKPKS